MAESIGSVSVEVVPDAKGFWERFKAQTQGQADAAGREAGKSVSAGIAAQGGKAGDEFSRKMRQRMDAALRSLPQAKITADSSDADRKLALLRANLARLTDQRVLVNLSDDAALASLQGMRAQLEQIGSETPDIRIRVDTAAAIAELEALRAELGLVESQTDDATKHLSVMRTAIELLGPALVPLGGFALAGGAGLVAMGAAGVLAFKGVKAEMASGSTVGQEYAAGLATLKGGLSTLESVAASGVLDGFTRSVDSAISKMPQLETLISSSSQQLGSIGSKAIGGIAGGVENFAPVIQTVLAYVDQLAGKFESWASGPGGAKFADSLLTTFEQVAPVLGDLAQAAVQLIAALAPAGGGALSELDLLSNVINALPVDLLKAATTAYIAFRTAVAVTAGIKSATLALEGFAAAQGTAAAASGARGLAGTLGAGVARWSPYIAGAVAADFAVQSLVKTNNAWAQSNNGVKSFIGNVGTEISTLAHGDIAGFFTGKNVSSNLGVAKLASQIGVATDQYKKLKQAAEDATVVPMRTNAILYDTIEKYAGDNLTRLTNNTDLFNLTLAKSQTGLSNAVGVFSDYTSSVSDSANAEQKWLTQGTKTSKSIDGVAVYADTWKQALDESSGSAVKAAALIASHVDALNDDQNALKLTATEQARLGAATAGAMTKYKLSSDQLDTYAAVLGISAGELANGQVSSEEFSSEIGTLTVQVDKGSTSFLGLVDAVAAFTSGADNANTRGVLIGQVLKAANGDTLAYANTMVQAAAANQQMVTDFASLKSGVLNLKTGVIDYHNAAAAPLLNDLQGMQTAAMNASAATYQHETAIGKASAADDAFAVYVNDTRGALINQAEQMGLTKTQAGKLADQYFGLKNSGDIKKKIEMIGKDETLDALKGILDDLDILAGKKPRVDVVIAATYENFGAYNKLHPSAPIYGPYAPGATPPATKAAGGFIAGPGTGTSDSIAARLSNGEFVVKASQTSKHRDLLEAINSGAPGFESGGFVGVNYGSTATAKAASSAAAKKTAAKTAAKITVTVDSSDLTSFLRTLPTYVSTAASQVADAFSSLYAKVSESGASKSFKAGLARENTLLVRYVGQLTSVEARLSSARDKLAAAVSTYNDQKATAASAVSGTFNISSAGVIPAGTTSAGLASGVSGVSASIVSSTSDTVTTSSIMQDLAGKVADAKRFSADLQALAKRGLGGLWLQQFAAAGPSALPQVEALMTATKSQISWLNTNGNTLTGTGSALGSSIATDLYGAGVRAAQGLVNGLTSQDKQLTAAVKNIANLMVAQIKTSLKIHSPSQVFHELGSFTGQGLVNGMVSQLPAVRNAAELMANRATPASQVGQWSGRGVGAGVTVHQTINPQPGMSEMAIGRASASSLDFALRSA